MVLISGEDQLYRSEQPCKMWDVNSVRRDQIWMTYFGIVHAFTSFSPISPFSHKICPEALMLCAMRDAYLFRKVSADRSSIHSTAFFWASNNTTWAFAHQVVQTITFRLGFQCTEQIDRLARRWKHSCLDSFFEIFCVNRTLRQYSGHFDGKVWLTLDMFW